MIGVNPLKNAYAGQACLLLGNGPSLGRWYEQLPEMGERYLTIGMNKSHLPPLGLEHLPEYYADYHCVVNASLLRELCHGTKQRWRKAVVSGMSNRRHLRERDDAILLNQVGYESIWRYDLVRGSDARFVGMMSLQLACWFGCSPIFLLGYDAHADEAHHWGGTAPRRRTPAERARYFHVADFERAQTQLQRMDFEVYNANPHSAITAFAYQEPD